MSRSIVFKIGTANVQSLPPRRSIADSFNSLNGCHLRGLQEVDLTRYQRATLDRYPHAIGIGTSSKPRGNQYSCPIAHNAAMFTPAWKSAVKLYDGHEGISLTRHLTQAGFRHKGTGWVVGMVNLHSVVTHGRNRPQRAAMKVTAKRVTFTQVLAMLASGHPVVVTGDFNDTANWFGKSFHGHRVQVVKHGIDQVVLIDGAHHYWTVESHKTRQTGSDHDTLRIKVRLTLR